LIKSNNPETKPKPITTNNNEPTMKLTSLIPTALLVASSTFSSAARPNLRGLQNSQGFSQTTQSILEKTFPKEIITTDQLAQVQAIINEQLSTATTTALQDTTFDGDIMVNITEQDSYNQSWVAFTNDTANTNNQTAAYAAISNAIVPGQYDIRAVYYEYYASSGNWLEIMLATASALAGTVADQCDQACFNVVELQLINEFIAVSYLYDWMTGYVNTQSAVSQHILNELDGAHSLLSVSATEGIQAPKSTPWVGTMINVLMLTQGLATAAGWSKPMVNLITVTQKTAQFVYTQNQEGIPSNSQGSVEFQNDSLNLAYSTLVQTIQSTYDDLNEVANNQARAMCANFGKLMAFYDQVYPQSAPASPTEIANYVGLMDEAYIYESYEWLFPSKYQMCSQVVDYYDGATDCIGYKTNPHETYHLGTAKGNEQQCYQGQCQSKGKTCQVNAYVWLCLKGSDSHVPPSSVTSALSTNSYAISAGLIKNNDFTSTVLNACKSDFKGGTCNAAGMALSISKSGDCVEKWSSADGSGSCDPFSYFKESESASEANESFPTLSNLHAMYPESYTYIMTTICNQS
ncbi:MAG: hypothetical protein SGILL_009430, partial [Bacillariaceae sp.]